MIELSCDVQDGNPFDLGHNVKHHDCRSACTVKTRREFPKEDADAGLGMELARQLQGCCAEYSFSLSLPFESSVAPVGLTSLLTSHHPRKPMPVYLSRFGLTWLQ